jgi:hypothetical protein
MINHTIYKDFTGLDRRNVHYSGNKNIIKMRISSAQANTAKESLLQLLDVWIFFGHPWRAKRSSRL